MLSRFDHLTIVVQDVERAAQRYSALFGAEPSWRGSHPELGTQAVLFGLGNALIELVGPQAGAPVPEAEGMRNLLEARGEGLQAVAFGTDDAAACSSWLRQRGARATPAQSGEARGDDGSVREYRAVELSAKSTRGVGLLVVERADAPQLTAAESVRAPAAVEALDHVVIGTADITAALALYRDTLGIRLALDIERAGVRMLFFRIGGVTIEVVHDARLTEHDRLYGAAYRVRDIEAAHARMRAGGLVLSDVRLGRKAGTHVFELREALCGVPTLIIRDPARD